MPEFAVAERFIRQIVEIGGSNGHAIDPRTDLLAHCRIAEPPRRDIRQRERLAVDGFRQCRQKREQPARFREAAADRVGDHNLAVAYRLRDARNAKPRPRVEFERVDEVAIEAAQQNVGAPQAGHGADEYAVVAHRQVFAFDQQKAEIARKIGVLEISFVHRPRREHAHAGILMSRQSGQRRLHVLEERRVTQHAEVAMDFRNAVSHGETIFERVADTGWRLRAVAQHPPLAVRSARKIGGINPQMCAARRSYARKRTQIGRIAGDKRGRQPPFADKRRWSISVRQNMLEQIRALDQSGAAAPPIPVAK